MLIFSDFGAYVTSNSLKKEMPDLMLSNVICRDLSLFRILHENYTSTCANARPCITFLPSFTTFGFPLCIELPFWHLDICITCPVRLHFLFIVCARFVRFWELIFCICCGRPNDLFALWGFHFYYIHRHMVLLILQLTCWTVVPFCCWSASVPECCLGVKRHLWLFIFLQLNLLFTSPSLICCF